MAVKFAPRGLVAVRSLILGPISPAEKSRVIPL